MSGSMPKLKMRRTPGQIVIGWVALGLLALFTLGPLLFIVIGGLNLTAWDEGVFSNSFTHSAMLNSFILALRAPLGAVIGFVIAWALIRLELPGKSWIEFGFWIAFFIPVLPAALGWILLVEPEYGLFNRWLQNVPWLQWLHFNIYSMGGILWVHMTIVSVPIMIILLGPALRNLDASLEESARTCGAPPRKFFFRITLPILAPAILAGTLGSFIRGLEAFEVEQMLGIPVGIYVFGTQIFDMVNHQPPKLDQAMALCTLLLFILLLLAMVYQQYTMRNTFSTVSGRGASFTPLKVGRIRYVYSGIFVLLLGVMVIVPLASLVMGSFMKVFGYFDLDNVYTMRNWEVLFGDPNFKRVLRTTFLLGLGAALLGTAVYAVLAYLITRTRVVGRRVMDLLSWIPWAIPGLMLGFALLVIVLFVPGLSVFYGSLFLMILAVVVSSMPIGVQMMKTSMGQISIDLEHSSQICGAGRLTTLYRIVLPIVRPMLVSIFVLTFMAGLRDTGTVIFLSSGNTLTLPILSLMYGIYGNLGAATAVSVVMTAIIIAVALVARFVGLNLDGGK